MGYVVEPFGYGECRAEGGTLEIPTANEDLILHLAPWRSTRGHTNLGPA